MAEYAPIFFPADRFSSTTSAATTAGQLVYVSGDNTVAPTTAATAAWIGVAARDAASGAGVTVFTEGIHEVASSGTINAGDVVIPAAAGAVAAIGAGTNYAQVVGVAIAAAASSKVRIKLRS